MFPSRGETIRVRGKSQQEAVNQSSGPATVSLSVFVSWPNYHRDRVVLGVMVVVETVPSIQGGLQRISSQSEQ